MATYREEADFTIRLNLSASFDEDYEGEEDGYAWLEQWREQVKDRLIRSVFETLLADGRFDVLASPRGLPADRAIEVDVRLRTQGPSVHRGDRSS